MVAIVVFITFLSKLLGFAREIVLSSYFGASSISDIYLVSTTIPITFWAIIGMGFVTVYIPIVSRFEEQDIDKINDFNGKFLNVILTFITALVIVFYIFSGEIISSFAYGFSLEEVEISISLTRIMIVSLYFTGIVAVATAYLHSQGDFKLVSAISFPLNLVLIVSMILAHKYEIMFLGYGFVLASLSQVFFIIPIAYKSGFRYKLVSPLKDENILKAIKLSLPVILGVSINQINTLVDRSIGSNLGEGSISYLNYGFIITSVVHTIIVMSLITIAYPTLSRLAVNHNIEVLKTIIYKLSKLVLTTLIPITIIFVFFSEEIIKLLYQRGLFDEEATLQTSLTFFCYSFGIIAVGFREVFVRIFYGFGNSKTPVINSIFCVAINVILSIFLSRFFGVLGVAIATTISAFLACILLWFAQRRLYGDLMDLNLLFTFSIRIIVISVISVFCIYYLNIYLSDFLISSNLSFFFSCLVGGGVYLSFIVATKSVTRCDLDIKYIN